ncbi:hypothetical protein [Paraconexibacter algicola]|uniref:hypothetical protein n=1 Tax=Paraconexibacter algicola TaxID=2133960 RepID=UPI0018EEB05E|nr:hypothetical protein [Paraconexibacter algicola]
MAPVVSPALDSAVDETGQLISVVLTFALAAVAAVYVARVVRQERAPWPLVLLAAGTLTCLLEPLFDHLYGLWFPTQGQWTLFTAYGVSEPVWLVPAYFAIYGGGAVVVMRSLRATPTRAQIWKLYWAFVGVAMVAEIGYVQLMGVYEYQDDQPWKVLGYPLFLGFVNSMSALIAGILAWRLVPLLRTPGQQLGLVVLTPLAFATEAFGSGVLYLALRHGSEDPNMVLLHVAALTVPLGTAATVKLLTLLIPEEAPGEVPPVVVVRERTPAGV